VSRRAHGARFAAAVAAAALVAGAAIADAATITIVNKDGLNEGFNDNTVVSAVGGNTATTRGTQRLAVFNRAAQIWGALLPSTVTIKVDATMDPMAPCDATSGVLGAAGSLQVFANFAGAEFQNTYYPSALANKLAGTDLNANSSDIQAQFNSSVDNSTCLGTSNWYYGFDHNEGTNVDLLATVEHELGHGLGFQSFANGASGAELGGLPDVFIKFLYDDTQGLSWDQMTDAQRAASAINTNNLTWRGPLTHQKASTFLGKRPFVRFEGDAAVAAGIAGNRAFGTAQYGPALKFPPLTAEIALVNDGVAPTSDGCESPFANGAALNGKIALIDRGTCTFVLKTEDAENEGAVAVIIINNVASPPVINMSGSSSTLIPTVSISQADGAALKNALLSGPVTATLGTEPARLAGADDNGWPLMYAPIPYQSGSSVSHFDISAFPNALMEPAINLDLTDNTDMTLTALQDIGWTTRQLGVSLPDGTPLRLEPGAPNPFRVRTALRYALPKAGLTEMRIFDIGGRMVKQVMRPVWMPAGSGSIVWDATDERGWRVAPGVYLYRMTSAGTTVTQRVVVSD